MILVNNALEQRERFGPPIRVAMVGAGFMARAIALQINRFSRGMRLVAIVNRTLNHARKSIGVKRLAAVDFHSSAVPSMTISVHEL